MKIREAIYIHSALIQLSGGPGMPAKLGKYAYAIIKNIRLFEHGVVNDFRDAQKKILQEIELGEAPGENASEEQRKAYEDKVLEVNKRIEELAETEVDVKYHALPVDIIESDLANMTAGIGHALFPILAESQEKPTKDQ